MPCFASSSVLIAQAHARSLSTPTLLVFLTSTTIGSFVATAYSAPVLETLPAASRQPRPIPMQIFGRTITSADLQW
ncbi:hypothetical protein BJ912DRAFT_491002 [Pholiota molesta]|nr:hypothetical protein BJ912DRAFT_491002 [Pholiota molesta]